MSLTALNSSNLPTPKEETWKYTNLPRAVPLGLTPSDAMQEEIVHISRGQICEEAVEFLFKGESGKTHTPRLKIILEEGAQLTLIERHEGSGEYWKNMATEIELGANAKLTHLRLQEDSSDAVQTNMVSLKADQDAVYNGLNLNMGGKLTRHEIHAVLNGPNAEVSFNGLNLLNGTQHGDATIVIEHAAPHCRSNQFYRSLLDDKARGVFQGKVHVHQVAQKTDGYQLSNVILLSEGAEMDVKPELEIYADDVLCSHGSTCGQLDEEPLFYLRSRGLNEAQAKFLLVQAFVGEVVDKIGDDDLQSLVTERIEPWLQTALS